MDQLIDRFTHNTVNIHKYNNYCTNITRNEMRSMNFYNDRDEKENKNTTTKNE